MRKAKVKKWVIFVSIGVVVVICLNYLESKLKGVVMKIVILLISLLSISCSSADKKVVGLSGATDISFAENFFGNERLILLGESTHGTSEYYRMRAEITKHLIERGGISFVAVEGDWVPLSRLNRYVQGKTDSSARSIMEDFERWPRWMWANEEFLSFIKWLREHNLSVGEDSRIGVYGIDVYGQWEAIDALKSYVEQHLPDKMDAIFSHLSCFDPYLRDEQVYARAVFQQAASCQSSIDKVVEFLRDIDSCCMMHFSALQKARAIRGSESFFRLSVRRGPEAWNSRAEDFFNNTKHIMSYYGEGSRGVVWAHNTHVGDSRATIMAQQGQVNIGSVARESLGAENVKILGFSTSGGSVVAGREWGRGYEVMSIPDPQHGSLEHYFSNLGEDIFFIDLTADFSEDSPLVNPIPHRAIGVVYRPENERGNYVPTVASLRYDGMVYFKKTEALAPIE